MTWVGVVNDITSKFWFKIVINLDKHFAIIIFCNSILENKHIVW